MLDRAANGIGQFALIAGAAGVGKSSLLDEFSSREGVAPLVGSCLPLGEHGVPFAPIVEILRSMESDPRHATFFPAGLGSLEPAIATGASEPTSRVQLFQSVLALLARLARSESTVLVIEDIHWADRSTRDLLSFLIPNLRSEPLLMILTYRTEDVHRDHPLRPTLAELQRNPSVEHLDVLPFDRGLVAAHIANLTGAQPVSALVDAVMHRTEGNPYFIEELATADAFTGETLPASLRELLLVRADVLSADARRTLRILALADSQVDDRSLALVAQQPLDDVREHVREAIDRRLLVPTATGTRFAHALLREVLQDDLLVGERAEYHAAWADLLDAEVDRVASNRAGSLALLAHHRAGAGDMAGALQAWSMAATAAEGIFAFAEAHHHLSRIIANWNRDSSARALVGADYDEVVARAAENAFMAGSADAASALAREAIELVDALDDPRRSGVLHERLARYVRDTADADQALQLVRRAVDLVPSQPPSTDRARVLAGLAGQLMTDGQYIEARRFATEAAEMARACGSVLAESDALNTLGVLATMIDDVERGIALIRAARELAEQSGDPHQQMRSYWNAVSCLSDAGDWERALVAFHEAEAQLPRLGLGHLLPDLFANAADILLRLGRWDEAQAIVDEARERFADETDVPVMSELPVERGDFDTARELIGARLARRVFTDREQQGWPLVHLAALENWQGHHDAARLAVDEALEITAGTESPIATAYALAIGCRCEADVAEHARRYDHTAEEEAANSRAQSFADHMSTLMQRPGPAEGWKREVGALRLQCDAELLRASGVADPTAWATVTAAWDAMNMPYHGAYTRFRQAEAANAVATDRERLSELLMEAHGVSSSLGAAPLQLMIEAFARRCRLEIGATQPDRHPALTKREHEVLQRLSAGDTNRQIAAALFISEKTASVHVSNVIRKLGASNRGQAAAIAHRSGLVT